MGLIKDGKFNGKAALYFDLQCLCAMFFCFIGVLSIYFVFFTQYQFPYLIGGILAGFARIIQLRNNNNIILARSHYFASHIKYYQTPDKK